MKPEQYSGPNLCANLRWKGMFVDALRDPTVQPGNDRIFWCLHTQNCLGPDGKVAEDEACGPSRGCYTAE